MNKKELLIYIIGIVIGIIFTLLISSQSIDLYSLNISLENNRTSLCIDDINLIKIIPLTNISNITYLDNLYINASKPISGDLSASPKREVFIFLIENITDSKVGDLFSINFTGTQRGYEVSKLETWKIEDCVSQKEEWIKNLKELEDNFYQSKEVFLGIIFWILGFMLIFWLLKEISKN